MSNILMIDVAHSNSYGRKGTFIPLAYRRLATKHKLLGDSIEYINAGDMPKQSPNIIYFSLIFLFNAVKDINWILTYKKKFNKSKILIGGTALTARPDIYSKYFKENEMFIGRDGELEQLQPDFDFVPTKDYSYGFTSRGCPNKCGGCFVPKLEGRQNIVENWKSQIDLTKKIFYSFDNNLLACGDKHVRNVFEYLHNNNIKLDCNQGMDAEILTKNKKIQQVFLDYPNIWHCARFSWDGDRCNDYIKFVFKFFDDNKLKSVGTNVLYMLYDSPFLSPEQFYENLKYVYTQPKTEWAIKPMRYKDMESGVLNNYWGSVGKMFADLCSWVPIGLINHSPYFDFIFQFNLEQLMDVSRYISEFQLYSKNKNTKQMIEYVNNKLGIKRQ